MSGSASTVWVLPLTLRVNFSAIGSSSSENRRAANAALARTVVQPNSGWNRSNGHDSVCRRRDVSHLAVTIFGNPAGTESLSAYVWLACVIPTGDRLMKRSSQSRAKDIPSQLFAANPALLIGAAFEIGMLL